ncbi:hypothetical protein COV18_05930 [Candidatus Woesearchaeota archaeon CG10_big_fil_rev_8_21_14_0_10_37_12]|nr:MAG: hypothetical protein COV18_05930 [Candidatus Woesearchaeota archaeon CG10_big_fil_rev_8_21_14_0_10_37_12]
MGKKILIALVCLVIIVILLLLALQYPVIQQTKTVQTTPQQYPEQQEMVEQEQLLELPTELEIPTPRSPALETRPAATPKAPEPELSPTGVSIDKVFPQTVQFWVNTIKVPDTTGATEYTYNYIPVQARELKTFAGSFGPYAEDPIEHIIILLCAELTKITAAPSCQPVNIVFRDGYVSFAKGYQYDEYIGGMAAKDYTAYYEIHLKETDTIIRTSNKAFVRTVN